MVALPEAAGFAWVPVAAAFGFDISVLAGGVVEEVLIFWLVWALAATERALINSVPRMIFFIIKYFIEIQSDNGKCLYFSH